MDYKEHETEAQHGGHVALYCSYLCGVGAWQHQLLPSQAGLHLASLGHPAAPYGLHGKGTQRELKDRIENTGKCLLLFGGGKMWICPRSHKNS